MTCLSKRKTHPRDETVMEIVHDGSEPRASGNLTLGASGHFLRSKTATVNFTSAEAKIVVALVDAGAFGLSIPDMVILLDHEVSDSSIHVGRMHISKIRQKIHLIGEARISLSLDKARRRYAFVASKP